jgi:hypothetical protein
MGNLVSLIAGSFMLMLIKAKNLAENYFITLKETPRSGTISLKDYNVDPDKMSFTEVTRIIKAQLQLNKKIKKEGGEYVSISGDSSDLEEQNLKINFSERQGTSLNKAYNMYSQPDHDEGLIVKI